MAREVDIATMAGKRAGLRGRARGRGLSRFIHMREMLCRKRRMMLIIRRVCPGRRLWVRWMIRLWRDWARWARIEGEILLSALMRTPPALDGQVGEDLLLLSWLSEMSASRLMARRCRKHVRMNLAMNVTALRLAVAEDALVLGQTWKCWRNGRARRRRREHIKTFSARRRSPNLSW